MLLHLTSLFGLAALLAVAALPARADAPRIEPAAHLSPERLAAIRGIGRNVLAAKKSGVEDDADAAQLARLRASLDALIAADLDPKNRTPITVQGQETGEQRKGRERVVALRESTRADARTLATQLRGTPEADTRSAGLPIGAQRARLFDRWAQELDTALAEGNEERAGQLRELRNRLRATKGSVNPAPLVHGTPTLQAMPAGYLSPRNDGAASKGR